VEAEVAPYILTLKLDDEAQAWFDGQRKAYFPPALNRIAAHVTFFHLLPQEVWVREVVEKAVDRVGFAVGVAGVRSLGRGVAYGLESAELLAVHRELSGAFREVLTAQDRQGCRPHVVVQNKVSAEEARALRARLEGEFRPFEVRAVGLQLWFYLGGPWKLAEEFPFG
jgi:hypothetical protein